MHCARYRLPHDSHAPAEARRALDPLQPALEPHALEDLRLLVSELVTNAILHGRPVGDDGVELGIWLDGDRAGVEVVDGGDGFAAPEPPPEDGRLGGWGLLVVDRLADRWGVDNNGRTRVWLEFSLLADATSV